MSIRRRLLLPLGIGLSVLFLVASVLVYHSTRASLMRALDLELARDSARLASDLALHLQDEHEAAFSRLGSALLTADASEAATSRDARALHDLASRALEVRLERPVGPSARPLHYEVRDPAGRILAGSGGAPFVPATPPGEDPFDVTLDGEAGRAHMRTLEAVPFRNPTWQAAWPRIRDRAGIAPRGARVIVARSTREQVAMLAELRTRMLVGGLLLVVAVLAFSAWTIRRALSPLRDLEQQVRALSEKTLADRIRAPATRDLVSIVAALNDSLDRLERAFDREKRMATRIAHELRTPVAELRSITEVAMQWPADETLQAQCTQQCQEIAVHMSQVVSALLRVARAQAGEVQLADEPVDLRARVEQAWSRMRSAAHTRNQTLTLEVAGPTWVRADPEVVDTVVGNLLQNAVSHAPSGSDIACSLRGDLVATQMTLANPVGSDVGHDGGGLGLALVGELASATEMGFEAGVEDGVHRARLALPSASEPHA